MTPVAAFLAGMLTIAILEAIAVAVLAWVAQPAPGDDDYSPTPPRRTQPRTRVF